jgi:hypothetical protein
MGELHRYRDGRMGPDGRQHGASAASSRSE